MRVGYGVQSSVELFDPMFMQILSVGQSDAYHLFLPRNVSGSTARD
jgi:hypothetical protein